MLSFRTFAEYALCEYADLVEAVPVPPVDPLPDDPPGGAPTPPGLSTFTQRYSSHSFATRSTDAPADTFIPGRLARGITIGRRINQGPEGQFGGLIVAAFGEIELTNNDGALDFLADDYFVDGRLVTIKVGRTEINSMGAEVVQPYANFQTIYTATAGAWTVEHDAIRLRIRDAGITLQRQLQTATYGGTGGQQGTSAMAGRTLPVCLGQCQNVSPQQVDPVLLTYQVHDGGVQAITGVRDRGISLTFDQDYPSYPTLAVATIPAGPPARFATSRAAGCFRLGTSPDGTVTADVDGDNTGADWAQTHATVIRRILTRYSWMDPALIDEPSFLAYHAAVNDRIGVFLPAGDQSTLEQVIERIAVSGTAVAGQDRSGLYRVQHLGPPTNTPVRTFTNSNITRIERLPLPYGVPWRKWIVEGVRNDTVQQGSELAGGVSQSGRRFFEAATRSAAVDVPNVSRAHPSAADAVRPSFLRFLGECSNAAVRLATFYAMGRALYRLTVRGALFQLSIGQTVRIVYPRWNLAQGRNFIVVAGSDDAVETELEVFG